MNLYLVTRKDSADWDEYVSFVVVCENEDIAKNTHPDGRGTFNDKDDWGWTWCDIEDVVVDFIGVTDLYNHTRVICSSFNAG